MLPNVLVRNVILGALGLCACAGTKPSAPVAMPVVNIEAPPAAATRTDASDSRSGTLDASVIQAVVDSHRYEMIRCYERGERLSTSLNHQVKVRFVIARSGKVSRVSEEAPDEGTAVTERKVVDCVLDQFRKMIFSATTSGPVTVVYPFELSP